MFTKVLSKIASLIVLSAIILTVTIGGWMGQAAIASAQAPTTCANSVFTILGDPEEPANNRLGFVDVEIDGTFTCLKVTTSNASVELASARRSNAELGIVEIDDTTFIVYSIRNRPMGSRLSVMVRRLSDDPAAFGLTGAATITGATTGIPSSCANSTTYGFNRTNEHLWNDQGWMLDSGVYSEGTEPGGWSATWTTKLDNVMLEDMDLTTPSGDTITSQVSCVSITTWNAVDLTGWDPATGEKLSTVVTATGPGWGTAIVYSIGQPLPQYIWVAVRASEHMYLKGVYAP